MHPLARMFASGHGLFAFPCLLFILGCGNESDPAEPGPLGATAAAVCPRGAESMSLTLTDAVAERIMGVPPGGYDSANLEGPVWIDGALYLSEIGAKDSSQTRLEPDPGRILKYVPGGAAEVVVADAGTNGLAVDSAGDLVAASHKEGAIVRYNLHNLLAPPQPVAVSYENKRFNSPNDLALRSDGNIYFTDPDYQAGEVTQDEERVYRMSPTGEVTPISGVTGTPNGISLSPDERTLYVGGSEGLLAFPVAASGSVGTGFQFGAETYRGVDGMGVDCAGNLYVTLYGAGKVVVLSPSGEKLQELNVGQGVTNVAFGGTNRMTLFITRMTPPSLYALQVGMTGLPY